MKEKGRIIPGYPEEREDWLMVEAYTKQKSVYGCILCEKTHSLKDCEHKAKRTTKSTYADLKSQYNYNGYGD